MAFGDDGRGEFAFGAVSGTLDLAYYGRVLRGHDT